MTKYDLGGKWRMIGNGYDVQGQIPGSVYSFLCLDNALLPDPHAGENEDLYLALSEHDYTFERTFPNVAGARSVTLVFEGLDTLCSIYLNGTHVANTDNMHLRYEFDVTKLLRKQNLLQVICHSPTKYIAEQDNKSHLFGATDCMRGYPHLRKAHCMMGWDWGPRLPDAGIRREVYLLEHNSCGRILDVRVTQRHEDGKVFLTPAVEFVGDGTPEFWLTAPDGTRTALCDGVETEVQDPQLWWPNGLGEQPLYTLQASLMDGETVADARTLKIGLRKMELVREPDAYGIGFYHRINGVPMFAMGADYIPEDNILRRITPERTRVLLQHCKDAHFNAIRVWGGGYYPDDWFFDICDELGLVVFFDLMFACSVYDPDEKLLSSMLTEVDQNARRIRHHACLGLICGNNEIEWHFHDYVVISGRGDREHLEQVYLDLFEKQIPAVLAHVCPEIAYIPSSPTSLGGFADPNGESCGDCHDWNPDHLSFRNRFYRYVSEFGFQSLPSIKTIAAYAPEGQRNLCSPVMERHQRSGGGNELILSQLAKYYPYASTTEQLVYASQQLQAESVRYRVEHMRRHRGRCMGALYWQLNDIWPGTSWSSIDYFGRYKALQYTAKRFFAPVLISCEEQGMMQHRGNINAQRGTYQERCSYRLCVTNDATSEISGRVVATVRDSLGNVLARAAQEVTVPALSVLWLDNEPFDFDPYTAHLQYALEVDGKTVSEGCALFVPPKHYTFADPRLTIRREGDELVITAAAFAKGVFIEGIDGDVILSDNSFDMEAGEKRLQILSGNANEFAILSLYDLL